MKESSVKFFSDPQEAFDCYIKEGREMHAKEETERAERRQREKEREAVEEEERRKANEARKLAKAKASGKRSDKDLLEDARKEGKLQVCNKCKEEFPSKSKLFKHLKVT